MEASKVLGAGIWLGGYPKGSSMDWVSQQSLARVCQVPVSLSVSSCNWAICHTVTSTPHPPKDRVVCFVLHILGTYCHSCLGSYHPLFLRKLLPLMSWIPVIHHVLGIDCPSSLGCLLCLGYLLSLCLGYLLSLCLGYLLSLMSWVPRVPYVLGVYLLGQADSGLLPWVRCLVMKEVHRQNLASRVLLESLDNTVFKMCWQLYKIPHENTAFSVSWNDRSGHPRATLSIPALAMRRQCTFWQSKNLPACPNPPLPLTYPNRLHCLLGVTQLSVTETKYLGQFNFKRWECFSGK